MIERRRSRRRVIMQREGEIGIDVGLERESTDMEIIGNRR